MRCSCSGLPARLGVYINKGEGAEIPGYTPVKWLPEASRGNPYPYLRAPIDYRRAGLDDYMDYIPPPESTPEAIFDSLWTMARELFPQESHKAETWVREQAVRYGIAEAKSQAVQLSQSPLLWIGGGLVLALLLNRR